MSPAKRKCSRALAAPPGAELTRRCRWPNFAVARLPLRLTRDFRPPACGSAGHNGPMNESAGPTIGSSRLAGGANRRRRVRGWCSVLLAALLAGTGGCGRSGSSSTADASAAGATETARLLGELTQQVRKYAVEQRQTPKGLEDLVAKGYLDRLPAAPAGKRFTISPKLEVELVKP